MGPLIHRVKRAISAFDPWVHFLRHLPVIERHPLVAAPINALAGANRYEAEAPAMIGQAREG